MDKLGWKVGDEISVSVTEICDDNGECNGFVNEEYHQKMESAMRITIESTVSEPDYSIKATIETAQDDYSVAELMLYIKQVLLGYGFHEDSIDRAIIEEGIMLQDELDKREKS